MKKLSYFFSILLFTFFAFPFVSFAQSTACHAATCIRDFKTLVQYLLYLMGDLLVPIFLSIAVLGFFWGVIKYVLNPANSDNRAQGREYMMWGLLGLFVIFSVWGLVQLLQNTFGIGGGGTIPIPTFET